MSAFSTSIQYCTGVSSQGHKAMKRNKRPKNHGTWSKTIFIYRWHHCLFQKNPMGCTKSY